MPAWLARPEPPPKQWIFDDLNAAEVRAVTAYVMSNRPGTKSTMYPLAAQNGDYITGTSAVELIPPPKAEALAFVEGDSAEPPPRFARVTVARGSLASPDVMEYKVGPLHGCDKGDCSAASVEPGSPLVPLLADGAVSFEKRPVDMSDSSCFAGVPDLLLELQELLVASFGPVFDDSLMPGCGAACFSGKDGKLFPFPFNDISATTKVRVSKMQFFWYRDAFNTQAIWLHGLPFTFRVAQRGAFEANTTLYDLYYCGQGPFASAAALLAAAPTRCTYKPSPQKEGAKGSWDVPGATAATATRFVPPPGPLPPRTFSLRGVPGGNGRLVQWQGWSFFATMRPSTGLAALDVRFKGRRVAYELALSEAAAHYSGTGNDQVFYLDGAYSMSQLGGDIKPGVDCPADAAFLDGTLWVEPGDDSLESNVAKARPYKAFCVFEETLSGSHWRHMQYATKRVDGLVNAALVVRAITAVGNYDYITELRFGLDGALRVQFDFAGYMETRWFAQGLTPWERSIGEVVHQNLAAPLHSHFGCFKVDLDVGESGESVEHTSISAGFHPDVPDLRGWATKYVTRDYPATEGVGTSTFLPDTARPGMWALVDAAETALDDATPTSKPGYVISVGPTVGQTLPDDHPFVLASAFSKYTLAVTRRKEDEQRATSVYDLFGPAEPVTSLDRFLDGESIVQQDLVAWVTVGKEHLPRTEDVPLISNFGTYFDVLPRNIRQGNAAMDVM